jgi:hypothetical protein
VVDPLEEIFDFASAEFSLSEIDGLFPGETALRGEEPRACVVRCFQNDRCPVEQPDKAHHAIGFLRIKPAVDLSTVKSCARDLEDRAESIEGNAERPLQLLRLSEGEAFLDGANHSYRSLQRSGRRAGSFAERNGLTAMLLSRNRGR